MTLESSVRKFYVQSFHIPQQRSLTLLLLLQERFKQMGIGVESVFILVNARSSAFQHLFADMSDPGRLSTKFCKPPPSLKLFNGQNESQLVRNTFDSTAKESEAYRRKPIEITEDRLKTILSGTDVLQLSLAVFSWYSSGWQYFPTPVNESYFPTPESSARRCCLGPMSYNSPWRSFPNIVPVSCTFPHP
ncbi:hypothetical protein CDAR_402121 [Caerostris darwini]|uniref:Uncharacterized protein n=1 Tax=Caerostris darwini TaxID=1538125 RepID=A0AAV4T5W4_9ARAC|nr:hypothetical protein CDAR_402121 [Caerostris darwini]